MTKTIVVTGASSGIGLATSLRFARRGWVVYAGVREPDRAVELREAIQAARLRIQTIRLDVDDTTSVRRCIETVLGDVSRIDVLVNNAGIGGGGPIEEAPIEIAKQLFETNYFGAIRLIQAVLPGMRRHRRGAIVNISSVFGRISMGAHGHYSAAKHALEAASEALAQEVAAYGIRVVLVEPGVVRTSIFGKNPRALEGTSPYVAQTRRLVRFFRSQLQHPALPDDVAETIEHAATTDEPRLRYRVGEDAELLVSGRARTTDEEWVAHGAVIADEEWAKVIGARYGLNLS